jgi:predicted nucleotidyltransferase
MKTRAEILEILRREKPELARCYGLKRLALFGSYAREDQREDSDVDILVEIEPQIGLRFVELADRIEDASVFAPRSSRAGRSSRVIGRSSKGNWSMSRRAASLLVEDIWEAPGWITTLL